MMFLDELIRIAFLEDIGSGDLTSDLLIDSKTDAVAEIVSKDEGMACGLLTLEKIFRWRDPEVRIELLKRDGEGLRPGDVVCRLHGNLRSILGAERIALNFLGRLSGIATYTARFVKEVAGLPVDILDTRKTTPGFRFLEKFAVTMGGGKNHRFGLYDALLIKENHLQGITLKAAIEKARQRLKPGAGIEAEVTNLREVKEAVDAKADIILLDNFSLADTKEAVQMIKSVTPAKAGAKVEFSGGVNLSNVRAIAETGVDRISIGQLTHSAPNFDFSLLVRKVCEHGQNPSF